MVQTHTVLRNDWQGVIREALSQGLQCPHELVHMSVLVTYHPRQLLLVDFVVLKTM